MSREQHPSSREQHAAHADERARLRALARQEQHAALRMLHRALRAMVQPHEPHHYSPPVVAPSPRRELDWLAAPGGTDHTGFCPEGGVC